MRMTVAGIAAVGWLAVTISVAVQPPASTQPGPEGAAAGRPATSTAGSQSVAELPYISYEDLVLLVQTSRRAFEEKATGKAHPGAIYRPPALRGRKAIIHLALRSKGYSLAEAEYPESDLVDAALAAGTLLGEAALKKRNDIRGVREGCEDLGLEFELLGPWEYLTARYGEAGTWSDELLHSFEPAVEGIGVEFRGKRAWTPPSAIISLNYTPDLALLAAESAVGLTHVDKLRFAEEIRYFRFRAYHLWQPNSHSLPIVLTRGATVVPSESVNAETLDAAIRRMGDFVHYRQNPSGGFAQEFLPGADKYDYEKNSALIQMEALQGLVTYGLWAGRPELIADAGKAARQSARYLRPLLAAKESGLETSQPTTTAPEAEQVGLVLWYPGHGNQLEISARYLMILTAAGDRWSNLDHVPETPSSGPASGSSPPKAATSAPATTQPALTVAQQRAGLIDGLLAAQEADGRIEMVFGERRTGDKENVEAGGWALLALANADPSRSDKRIERALASAFNHYRVGVDWQADPTAGATLARAFTLGYSWTNDARDSDLAFEILDGFASRQVGKSHCPWPELYGAINAHYQEGAIGVDTAVYMTALADGVGLAERIGDRTRAARYREAVKAAARFILQLEIREDGCYYIRSLRDALGGVRVAPWDDRLRIDYCAEALTALMEARRLLYGAPATIGR